MKTVLSRYPAAVQPQSRPEPLGNAGGLSGAALWRFASARGPLVLRAWPPQGPRRAVLEQIHRWLSLAGSTGLVPVPIAGVNGQTLHEHDARFWELAPWLPGDPDRERPPRAAHLRAGFAGLAALHASLGQFAARGASPGLARRAAELEALLNDEFRTLASALDAHRNEDPLPIARRWLKLARSLAPRLLPRVRRAAGCEVTVQPCLRDVRPEHLLFDSDRLAGIVDFGAMGVDTVAGDLARLLSEWVEPDVQARALAFAAYGHVRPLDDVEMRLIDVFSSSSALLSGAHWVRWHFVEGRTFENPSAVRCGLERSAERLAEMAARPLNR